MPITREKIKPASGVPLLLTLDLPTGQECTSTVNGTEWRYHVTHEGKSCLIYLPRQGHDAIQRLRPGVGDVIEIMRMRRGGAEYYDARFPDSAQIPPPGQAPAPRTAAAASHDAGHGYPLPPNGNGNGHRNGNGSHAPSAPAPLPEASSHLAQCLRLAIDAAMDASEYARSKNFSVTFLGSDIRAMANSVMIGDQQRGGR